nr:putative NADH-plastoquinone oxidoreductase subunit K [Picea sitchensis]
MKMAPSLVRNYELMPEQKYLIAMGTFTITGGMFIQYRFLSGSR